MRLRLKSVVATLLTTGMVAGMLGTAVVAQAATTPPFEPDSNARGCLNFYDATGNLKTSGSLTDSPIAAFALGAGPSRAGDNMGTLYAAQPAPNVPSQNWLTQQMSAGNAYPSTDPTTPANLRNSPNPLYIGAAGDASAADLLAGLAPQGNVDDGAYQIRFITNGPSSGTDTLYWRADIQITGNTWTQTFCPPPASGPQSTSTGLTVSPPSPQPAGTTVNLTASVSPTVATGSVQFQDNGANLGPAVSVTAGSATSSTSALAAGPHSLTAVFAPTDLGAFSGSTSAAVPYTITPVTTASTDLSITKTGPATAMGGDTITYTVTATNNGPSDATGVSVADTLPTGVGFGSANSSAGTCTNAASSVTCDIGPLANGASATITIVATAPATAGPITNTATIGGTETDPNAANNSASATTQVSVVTGASTDLSITKTGPATATPTSTISYSLTAGNAGPSDATGVVVTDTLPAGVGFVSATPDTCTNASGTVTCDVGSLANGASATITIVATAPATAGPITNTATISGTETDPNAANNTASATTQVTGTTGGSADLSISKYAMPGQDGEHDGFQVSNTFSYLLVVRNVGSSTATGVKVSDQLPAGLSFRKVSTTNGTCKQAGGVVTCDLGTLKRGRSARVTIKVTAGAEGRITNTATVSADQSDPHPKNNSSSVTITVAKPNPCHGGRGHCDDGGWRALLNSLRFD